MDGDGKCPVMGGAHRHAAVGTVSNQRWWPNQLNLRVLQQNSPLSNPMGEDFELCRGLQEPGSRCAGERHRRTDDDVAGLVAGGLRPLWAPCSSAWPGTAPVPTASVTAAVAPRRVPSASPPSTAGPTTPISTRRGGCSGRSSRSTASEDFLGGFDLVCRRPWHWSRWASQDVWFRIWP